MSLKFKCLDCGKDIVVKYLEVGENAQCKSCGSKNVVPETADEITEDYIIAEDFKTDMTKCPKCGAAVGPEAIFCQECGIRLSELETFQKDSLVEEQEEIEEEEQKETKIYSTGTVRRDGKAVKTGAIFVILAAMMALIFFATPWLKVQGMTSSFREVTETYSGFGLLKGEMPLGFALLGMGGMGLFIFLVLFAVIIIGIAAVCTLVSYMNAQKPKSTLIISCGGAIMACSGLVFFFLLLMGYFFYRTAGGAQAGFYMEMIAMIVAFIGGIPMIKAANSD